MARRRPLHVECLENKTLLSVSLTTNASSYQVGQSVQITFTETNDTSRPLTIAEGPSNDGFVIRQNGRTIWRSNAGINPMFLVADTLQPGQSLTLSGTWDGIPNVGSSTRAGLTGTFVVSDQLNPTASATFQINSSSSAPSPTAPSGSNTASGPTSPNPQLPTTTVPVNPTSPTPTAPENPTLISGTTGV